MKKSKKIDDLFKSKIPPGEVTPPNDLWEQIDSRLSKDRKRNIFIIPLWYKVAGVAAILLLILNLNLSKETEEPVINSPVITDQPINKPDETETSTEESTSPGAAKTPSNSQKIPATEVAQTKAKAGEHTHKTSSNSNFSQSPATDLSEVKTLEINFSQEKKSSFGFALTGSTLNLRRLETLTIVVQNSEEEIKNQTSDPDKNNLKDESFEDRLSISPTIAAVYFGKIGSGNALDNEFSQNSNRGEISLAYGVSVSYQISDKLSVRSGLNNVSLRNNTKNVDNNSASSFSAVEGNPAGNFFLPSGTATLNQHLDYLEVPLELEYSILDRKFGINLIAGASTFFLQENEVILNSATFSSNLGPANNLNKRSYSVNLGLGLQFRFSKKLYLNLDPVFKYQLGTYEEVSDVKPYHFGVYSGIRFRL
jgi:hypothetical protein